MGWNHRIIRHKHPRSDYYALHEVYYADGDTDCTQVEMYTQEPVEFVCDVDEGANQIAEGLRMALRSIEKYPVLNEEDLPGYKKKEGE